MARIIVYGGGFAGVAAAAKAASKAPNHSVILISPYPDDMLGGIGTSGGQNYWDVLTWPSGKHTACGSFTFWNDTYPLYYGVNEMSQLLKSSLGKYLNVSVYLSHDICEFKTSNNPFCITSVTVKKIYRDTDGNIKWGISSLAFAGDVFIDASDDGRLARMINTAVSTGRYDWPAGKLDPIEQNKDFLAMQQAATLMFKMTGVNVNAKGNMYFSQSAKGLWGCWGGTEAFQNPFGPIVSFNNQHAQSGYMIKPVNAAQDGTGSPNWWINALMVFNVDGRAHFRDKGTAFYPTKMISGSKSTDEAWIDTRLFLHTYRAEFERAMRSYPGFENASLVYSAGYPDVGTVLYLRETVHMSKSSTSRANGTEDTNYAVAATASLNAGSAPNNGKDAANYKSRIGLAMYYADVHPYKFTDVRNGSQYIWGADSWAKMRSDRPVVNPTMPQNPVYLPYSCLITAYVANLLIPGYAAGVSSYSWGEVRVFPNLCVLGDAAGVAAAYSVNKKISALEISWSDIHIKAIQNDLINVSARLDK